MSETKSRTAISTSSPLWLTEFVCDVVSVGGFLCFVRGFTLRGSLFRLGFWFGNDFLRVTEFALVILAVDANHFIKSVLSSYKLYYIPPPKWKTTPIISWRARWTMFVSTMVARCLEASNHTISAFKRNIAVVCWQRWLLVAFLYSLYQIWTLGAYISEV